MRTPISTPWRVSESILRVLLFTAVLTASLFAQVAGAQTAKSTTQTTRVFKPPVIDGILDDSAWKDAHWFEDFIQNQPVFGVEPSFPTRFATVFDDRAIYFAIRCEVDDPDTIVSRMTRRDRGGDFDTVAVIISPRNDGLTGYTFKVNPAGVQRDVVWLNDKVGDDNWDAIWHSETSVDEGGWTVEIAIPLDQIRFQGGAKTWGLQVTRWISNLQERDTFSPIAPEMAGWITAAGELKGVEDIPPRMPLSVTPEIHVSRTTATSGSESTTPRGFNYGAGGYARVGLAPDLTLDIAVNPDFGEVEVDQAVLNLTAYETKFAEKRPFFLEGAGMFTTPLQLFYSRRIGGAPPAISLGDDETLHRAPTTTPILTAVKVTGRSSNGISLGMLDALMMPTNSRVMIADMTAVEDRDGTPWTNAAVLRMTGELDQGSVFGVMGTALNPAGGNDGSYTGGIDWNLLSDGKDYSIQGQTAASLRLDETLGREQSSGGALWTKVEKRGGEHIRSHVEYKMLGEGFDPNDLGYLVRDDLHRLEGHLQIRQTEKMGPFMQLYVGTRLGGEWNTHGLDLGKWAVVYVETKWSGDWWTNIGGFGSMKGNDDREMRGGPALIQPAHGGGWFDLTTPTRSVFGVRFHVCSGSTARGYYFHTLPVLQLRLGRIELELSAGYKHIVGALAYVDVLNEDELDEEYVYGRRDLDQIDLGLKSTLVIARDLTFQINGQILCAHADYNHYRSLFADQSSAPTTYNDADADFAITDFQLQLLLRWEYVPGSTLYLVYTRLAAGVAQEGPQDFGNTMRTIDEENEQTFMIKLSHVFG